MNIRGANERLEHVIVGSDIETISLAYMAANGVDNRLPAVHEAAACLCDSLRAYSSNPPAPQRYVQEREFFHFVADAASAISCVFMLAAAITNLVPDLRSNPKILERKYPHDLAKHVHSVAPGDPILPILDAVLADPIYAELRDLRDVMDHRGALPRSFVGVGDPNLIPIPPQVAHITTRPRDAIRTIPGGWEMDVNNVNRLLSWTADAIDRILTGLEDFARRRRP
jgi:hypothetical protein